MQALDEEAVKSSRFADVRRVGALSWVGMLILFALTTGFGSPAHAETLLLDKLDEGSVPAGWIVLNVVTGTPTGSPTQTQSPTGTVPTDTPTQTATSTIATNTPTQTATDTISAGTPTQTATSTVSTGTPTQTATNTIATGTPTQTATSTVSTGTPTQTLTATLSHTPTPPDIDGDGVPDSIEDACPSLPSSAIQPTGDGNGDNVRDSEQRAVTSLPRQGATDCVTVENLGCTQNFEVRTFREQQLGNDPNYYYPFGLVGFSVCQDDSDPPDDPNLCDGVPPCASTEMRITFHGATNLSGGAFDYRKYGPTAPGVPGTTTFYTFPNVEFVGNTAQYKLNNGQFGDATGNDNIIVDPSGPALAEAGPVPAPALSLPALSIGLVVVAIVAVLAIARRRRDLLQHLGIL
jgi:hypothetical protein